MPPQKGSKHHNDTGTYFYDCWRNLKQRCSNKNRKDYKWYGEKNITYDSKWSKYINFKIDMWYKYTKAILCQNIQNPTIERMNIYKNYCKENCIFISKKDQGNNITNNQKKIIGIYNGKFYMFQNKHLFGINHNIDPSAISKCLNGKIKHTKGWVFKSV